MTVTFCGHRNLHDSAAIQKWLLTLVENLIHQGANTFLLGGYGGFDCMAANIIQNLKVQYPHIKSVLVLPYLDHKSDDSKYDYSVYPPLESIPKRYAILRRNDWMVDRSDIIVAYVIHSWGGAAKSLEYALRKHKTICLYGDLGV